MNSAVSNVILSLATGWCAGLNVYATVAVLGGLGKYLPGFRLPDNLQVLTSFWVLIPASLMYLAEFIADKIPAFETVWDAIQTFIRIPAGAALAAMAIGHVSPEIRVAAAIVGGALALQAHTTKVTTRIISQAAGTWMIVTPVASLLEDALVATTMALYTSYPVLSLMLVFGMFFISVLLLIFFWKFVRMMYRTLFHRKSIAVTQS
jgi:hypothetical protein